MSYISLGGAYATRSLIASAQRCVNLIVEYTYPRSGEPFPSMLYESPGTVLLRNSPTSICRCVFKSSNGSLFVIYGQVIYYVSSSWVFTVIGTMQPSQLADIVPRNTPCSMIDNGITVFVVDNSVDGWTFDLSSNGSTGFARINPTTNLGFYGSPRIDQQDTFFLFSKPNTNIWYVSDSNSTNCDPLQFSAKSTSPDPIIALAAVHGLIWILGEFSWEIWQGAVVDTINLFPYQKIPNAYGNWGCAALYSVAVMENQIFWLAQDKSGKGIVYMGESINAVRISTHAIENSINDYITISDAVGYCYQQEGHFFYVLNFPSANDHRGVTWVYDGSNKEWTERMTISQNTFDIRDWNGIEYRHRIQCCSEAYGFIIGGDWENSNFYQLDLNTYTDCGQPIVRIKSGQQEMDTNLNSRVHYKSLVVNMEVGSEASSTIIPAITVINCSFTGPDGTLLQNYSNSNDIGATFTKENGTTNAIIFNNQLVGQTFGSSNYLASGKSINSDYIVRFNTGFTQNSIPNNNSSLYVIGRADNSNNGYKSSITSNGNVLTANLSVMNTSNSYVVSIGTNISGFYEMDLTMIGTSISLSTYRSTDGYWLNSAGSWEPTKTSAISINDSSYPNAGRILIGGNWL